MANKELIQAGIQVEAMRELAEMVRPVVQKFVQMMRSRLARRAAQPERTLESPAGARTGQVQAHER